MLQGDRRVTIREVGYHNNVHFSRRIPPRALSQQSFPGVLNAAATLRLAIAAAVPFMLFTTQAMALGLGPAQVRSNLGQPLHVVIPVSAGSADEVGCVTITGGSDLPAPIRPRTEVQTLPGGAIVIDVTTPTSTSEPALGFLVSAGCQSAVSRTYTLFLDPAQATPDLPAGGNVVITPLPSTPIAAGSRRRRRGTAVPGTGNGANAALADSDSAPVLAAPRRPRAPSDAVPPRRERPAAVVVPPVLHTASATPSSADRFHLSNDLGTDLRLADTLGTPDAQPIDAQQLEQLKVERARLAAILAGQDPNAVNSTGGSSVTPALPSAQELELQNRVNGMSTQIAALQKQLAQQNEQNKELAAARSPGYLTWVFGVVALLALAVASWFGFRYRRAQGESLDQPWWEQSQLANVTERGGGETPFAVRADGVAGPAAIVEPEVLDLDHDTFIQTTRMSAARPKVADSMPLHDQEPSTVARGPVTVPLVSSPAPAAPVSNMPLSTPAAGPSAASLISPLAPGAAPTSQYGDNKTSQGTLDERIDSGIPKPLDFNLDLPPVTTNLGRDDRGVASPGSLQSAPAERPTEMAPLDFELPRGSVESDAPSMGPDTILRLDEPSGAAGGLPLAGSETEAEHASVQFRLIQFASVVEQAEELERSNEPTKAIAALRQYVLRDETIPTLMWLMLFALYKQVNKRPVYDALGEHFSRRYKRPMARWDESLQSIAPQMPLASLPELDGSLKAKWGTQAGIEMLRLLTCGRDQPNEIIFNAALQRDLLQMAKVFPLNDSI